jgi:hypothetical protein
MPEWVWTDVRVRVMATELGIDALTVIGGLAAVWREAFQHRTDTLSARVIDGLTRPGFAAAMVRDDDPALRLGDGGATGKVQLTTENVHRFLDYLAGQDRKRDKANEARAQRSSKRAVPAALPAGKPAGTPRGIPADADVEVEVETKNKGVCVAAGDGAYAPAARAANTHTVSPRLSRPGCIEHDDDDDDDSDGDDSDDDGAIAPGGYEPGRNRDTPTMTEMPPTWEPSETLQRLARDHRLDPRVEVERFKAFARSKRLTAADWDERFRLWVFDTDTRNRRQDPSRHAGFPPPRQL